MANRWIQKIYEDNASGKLSDERYATLSLSYEEEQKTLKAAVPEMQAYLETETDKTESLQRFIQKVKQITELKALTPELIHEFVDKSWCMRPDTLTASECSFWTSITAAWAFSTS